MKNIKTLIVTFIFCMLHSIPGTGTASSFFQASHEQPYHLSIGAVLFDGEGKVACHYFEDVFGYKDIYILMRESMENGETPLMTLARGLQEEFGAVAEPIAFLGNLSGYLPEPRLGFEKTTLYVACKLLEWHPENRDPSDPESLSTIQWYEPSELIAIMQEQGRRFPARIDANESLMVERSIPYIQKSLHK